MEKTIKTLENFKKAYLELIDEFEKANLNELDSIRFYPFQRSFDEYDVQKWIDETIKELKSKTLL